MIVSDVVGAVAMNYLDSPSTTSSTTYTVYFFGNSGITAVFNSSAGAQVTNGFATITLMEIAG